MNTVVLKIVVPKLPPKALSVPGPSVSGAQLMVMLLTSLNTVPPVEVPTNTPLAALVSSVTTRLKVKGLNAEPRACACVPQLGHARVKSPKAMFDGTPVVLLMLGKYVSVEEAPAELPSIRMPLALNPVPAEPVALVLYVIVSGLALALAAINKTATPVIEAAWIMRLSIILCCLSF